MIKKLLSSKLLYNNKYFSQKLINNFAVLSKEGASKG